MHAQHEPYAVIPRKACASPKATINTSKPQNGACSYPTKYPCGSHIHATCTFGCACEHNCMHDHTHAHICMHMCRRGQVYAMCAICTKWLCGHTHVYTCVHVCVYVHVQSHYSVWPRALLNECATASSTIISLNITLHIRLTHWQINTHAHTKIRDFLQGKNWGQSLEHISRQRRDLVAVEIPAQTQAGSHKQQNIHNLSTTNNMLSSKHINTCRSIPQQNSIPCCTQHQRIRIDILQTTTRILVRGKFCLFVTDPCNIHYQNVHMSLLLRVFLFVDTMYTSAICTCLCAYSYILIHLSHQVRIRSG
jgi:hypothetical protein